MKAAVVYYSLEGNTQLIAKAVAEALHADLFALKPRRDFPSGGFKKFFVGGMSAVFGLKPKLANGDIDLSGYDLVVLGSPVWVGKIASPFNTFLKHPFRGKNTALFVCCGGGEVEKALSAFKARLPGNRFIGETSFIEPLKNNPEQCAKRAREWILSLEL